MCCPNLVRHPIISVLPVLPVAKCLLVALGEVPPAGMPTAAPPCAP